MVFPAESQSWWPKNVSLYSAIEDTHTVFRNGNSYSDIIRISKARIVYFMFILFFLFYFIVYFFFNFATWGIRHYTLNNSSVGSVAIFHYVIVFIACSYQNQFMTSINYHMSAIFAKVQQHADIKIKVSIIIRLFVISRESINPALCKLYSILLENCVTLHKISYSNISIAISTPLNSYRISSWTLHNPRFGCFCTFFFLWSQSIFNLKKTFTQ